jgi:hypothetical protein
MTIFLWRSIIGEESWNMNKKIEFPLLIGTLKESKAANSTKPTMV